MAVVAALELRDPMVFFVLVKTGDPALHDAMPGSGFDLPANR